MLLRSDLIAVANSLFRRGARGPLVGALLTMSFLASLSWLVGGELARLEVIDERVSEVGYAVVFAQFFAPAMLVSVWFGLAAAQRMLFDNPALDLLLTAPISPTRVVFAAFLRVWVLTTANAAALVMPAIAMILAQLPHNDDASRWLPSLIALVAGPPLASVMAITLVFTRWFSGRLTRILLAILVALASLAFSLFLVAAAFARGPQAENLVLLSDDEPRLGWMASAAGNILAAAVDQEWQNEAVLKGIGFALLAVIALYMFSLWYPTAVEKAREAPRSTFGLGHRRPWPQGATAVLRRKEFARLLQEPRQLFGLLVYAVMLFMMARHGFLIGPILESPDLPRELRELAALLVLWFLGTLMSLPSLFGRFALGDGRQWSLYMSAPIRPWTLLLAKLQATWVLLLWPWLVVTALSVTVLPVSPVARVAYMTIGFVGALLGLGVTAGLATTPVLVRPSEDGSVGQGLRTLLAVFVLITTFQLLAAFPAVFGWTWLSAHASAGHTVPDTYDLLPAMLGGAAAYALAWTLLTLLWARRNVRVLLQPR